MSTALTSQLFRIIRDQQRHGAYARIASAGLVILAGAFSCSEPPGTGPPTATATDWIWAIKAQGWSTPATDSTRVYFVSLRHEVFAIDRQSGVISWQTKLPELGSETNGQTVGVSRGVVIAGDYDVYGLDAKTGALKWKFSPSDGYGPGVLPFTVKSDTVYVGSPAGVVYALDPTTGAPYWQTRVFAPDNPTSIFDPRADGDIIVAAFSSFAKVKPDTGGVVALDRSTGALRWLKYYPHRAPNSYTTTFSVGVAAGIVVGASTDGAVYAQNAGTGEIIWTAPKIDGPLTVDRDLRPVVVTPERVFVGSVSGFITAYSLTNGSQIWRIQLRQGAGTSFGMTADATNLYVNDTGGALNAFRVETGTRTLFESLYPLVTFVNQPWADGSQIFQAADSGFYAFKKP